MTPVFTDTEPDFNNFSPLLIAHLAEASPDRIYHYTSAEALHGVISKGEVWCTDFRFLNDTKELLHAIDIIVDIIDVNLAENDQTEAAGIASFLQTVKEKLRAGFPGSCFVASFTELPDSLSQWRAYCPPSGGYAIGIVSTQIQEVISDIGHIFCKCIYNKNEQTKILKQLITSAIAHYRQAFRGELIGINSMVTSSSQKMIFVHYFIKFLIRIALIMKHESFAEEKEWRIIVQGPDNFAITLSANPSYPTYGFRTSGKGFIPFYKLNLLNDKYPSLGRSQEERFTVTLGPAVDTEHRKTALDLLLSYYFSDYPYRNPKGYAESLVSSIPYKTW